MALKNQKIQSLSWPNLKVWDAVEVLPSSQPRGMFSTAVPRFLPVELKPLGLSPTGQLRVASQLMYIKSYGRKITITFWLFF
jgi:hypothetical protein